MVWNKGGNSPVPLSLETFGRRNSQELNRTHVQRWDKIKPHRNDRATSPAWNAPLDEFGTKSCLPEGNKLKNSYYYQW